MKKSRLSLGKVTYGTKDFIKTFHEAFAPYFEPKELIFDRPSLTSENMILDNRKVKKQK